MSLAHQTASWQLPGTQNVKTLSCEHCHAPITAPHRPDCTAPLAICGHKSCREVLITASTRPPKGTASIRCPRCHEVRPVLGSLCAA